MKIKITDSNRPFSHLPGTHVLLPGSSLSFTLYPTRIECRDLSETGGKEPYVLSLAFKAPIKEFTIIQEIERKRIEVFGKGLGGYFRYFLSMREGRPLLTLEKGEGVKVVQEGKVVDLKPKEEVSLPFQINAFSFPPLEKISFGSTKQLDWEKVKARRNLAEILPVWFSLGQMVREKALSSEGTMALLQSCEQQAKEKERAKIGEALVDLFSVGFKGIFSPTLFDEEHRGFALNTSPSSSPLPFLSEGASIIRRLLIEKKGEVISLLPCLPSELHAGRFVGAVLSPSLTVDFEWSKKTLHRAFFHVKEAQEIALAFQSEIKSFRLREKIGAKGIRKEVGERVLFPKEGSYLLDCFQK